MEGILRSGISLRLNGLTLGRFSANAEELGTQSGSKNFVTEN